MDFHKLKLAIERSGITITDLTKKVGIDRSTYYNNMEKKTLKVETLEKICNLIDKKVWEFFEGYQSPEEKKTLCEKELLEAYKELNRVRREKELLQGQMALDKTVKYKRKKSKNSRSKRRG